MRRRLLVGGLALILTIGLLAGCAENPYVKANGLFGLSQSRFDELFADKLDGLFTGESKETIYKPGIGSGFAMHFPDIIYHDGKYMAYYITYATENRNAGVGLATSTDGIKWTRHSAAVIEPNDPYDSRYAAFAGVWLDTDGTFYLVYEAAGTEKGLEGNIALATSKDGINWEKQGLILRKDTSLTWQNYNIGTPDLYKEGDTWYLTFHGFGSEGGDCQIGVAYGTDLKNLTMVQTPVVPTESGTAWSGTTGRRDIIKCGEYYYMVYEVSTDQNGGVGFDNAKWSHMFARSKDMLEWEVTTGPQLEQDKTGYGYDGPCWVVVDEELYVCMRNVSNSSTYVKID